jgi:hypothetical protein
VKQRISDAPPRRSVWWRVVTLLVLLGHALPVVAQIPHLDPLPWTEAYELGDANALQVGMERLWDSGTGWTVNRIGLDGFLRTSKAGKLFLRIRYNSFDSDGYRALERWPNLNPAPTESSSEVWPYEDRVDGIFRPEIGLMTGLGLPLLGALQLGLAGALPVGRDELYPHGGVSVPVRGDLRKGLSLGADTALGLVLGGLLHLDSARGDLAPEAFPGGWHGSVDLKLALATRHSLIFRYEHGNFEGRISDQVGVAYWLPTGSYDLIGLSWTHELAGIEHRPAQDFVRIVLRLAQRAEDTAAGDGGRRSPPGRGR